MWKRCSEGQTWSGSTCNGSAATYTWQAALVRVQAVNTSQTGTENRSYTDWRLPNVKEFQTIIERQCYAPAINLTAFPNTPTGSNSWYWSSTPIYNHNLNDNLRAWSINAYEGNSYFGEGFSEKTDLNYVRLVRGGH
jgi:Protein of unknown function (DUF1566).